VLESIILAVCLKGSSEACNSSLRAYYLTPTPITLTVKELQGEAVRAYKEVPILDLIGPVLGIVVQKKLLLELPLIYLQILVLKVLKLFGKFLYKLKRGEYEKTYI